MEDYGKAALAEFVATFGLIFIGAGAVLMAGPGGSGLIGVALAHGIYLAIAVSVTGHISGGVVNPAVAIALWIGGKLTAAKTAVFIVAECAGGVAGALLLKAIVPKVLFDAPSGGTPLLGNGMTAGRGVALEAVLTFFLVFAVYGTAVDRRGPFSKTAGLTIGLVLTFDILAGGPLTGAAMNPARELGPALASGTWNDWWVYWVGPIAGGMIGAAVYSLGFLREGEDE